MKHYLRPILLLAILLISFANHAQPAQVQKTNPTKVYMHYMPWFEGPTNPVPGGNYTWGYHWKMNNKNPNVIEANGQRQIASNYYPMIGPYASSDPNVVEYHLLLMKLSGIDGVLVDWYGTQGSNGDVGSLLTNSNALINSTAGVGVGFGLIMEDRFWSDIQFGRNSVAYARDNYFNRSNYIKVGSAPLVGVFGPITYQSGGQWSDILSNAGQNVEFLPLWDHAGLGGSNSDGEYTWVFNTNANDYLARLEDYYANRAGNQKTVMSVAYPRYNDYYAQGGAGNSLFYIDDNNGQTLNATLALCDKYKYNTDMVQLATFNDFGEGTVFEPTTQYGFRDLARIQQYTGVPYTQADLQQVYRLFTLRKKYAGNAAKQSQLNTAFNNFVALRMSDAKLALDAADGIAPVPQSPYGGTARNIPGKIEAEDFDNGGQTVAYSDVDASNNGGQYRTSEGVDMEACTEGGYNVGWTVAGEWIEYTVNVTTAGAYTLQARVAATAAGKSFHVELDGTNIGTLAVPNTGAWQTWQTVSVTTPNLSTGQKILRIAFDQGDFNINYLNFNLNVVVAAPVISSASAANGTVGTSFSYNISASNTPTSFGATGLPAGLSVNTSSGLISGTPTASGTFNVTISAANAGGTGTKVVTMTIAPISVTQSPFGGTARNIPGKIEAEDFDNGGQGVAYNDLETLNQGGQYRTSEGVDIEVCTDGGYNIGWTAAGEWTEYTVNVNSAGSYTLQARVASPNAGKSFHVELDGVNIGSVAVPNTGGWQTWQTVNINIPSLTTGQKVLRLFMDTDGFNISFLNFNLNAVVTAPVISSASTANGTVGSAFSYNITASNAPNSYNATGLPAGLSINTSSGLISGIPTTTGTYTVIVSASNTVGTGSQTLTLTIAPKAADPAGTITCYKAPGAITVDGSLTEPGWNITRTFSKVVTGTINNTATFGVLWDNTNLYIGTKVTDANLFSDSPDMWNDDAIEIYIDANNNKSTTYDGKDNQIIKGYNKTTVLTMFAISGLQHAYLAVAGGYTMEFAIPWTQLGITAPAAGTTIGFDIGNDDDDNGSDREGQMMWNGAVNNYQNTSAFGTLVLSGSTSGARLSAADWQEAAPETTNLILAPNPVIAEGLLTVFTPADWSGEVDVEVLNFQGVMIQKKSAEVESGFLSVNTSRLSPGKYVLHLRNGDKSTAKIFFVE
jgi:hypothetical protein